MSHSSWNLLPKAIGLTAFLYLIWQPPASASNQTPGKSGSEKKTVARVFSPLGSVLKQDPTAKTWNFVDSLSPLTDGDRLLTLPAEKAVIVSQNQAVRVTLVGNIPESIRSSALECRVVVHEKEGFDFDLTLETGLIHIANRREKGPARVRLTAGDESFEFVLEKPGDEVLAEHWGRWAPGMPFQRDPKFADKPISVYMACVVSGNVNLKTRVNQYALSAPPGPAIIYYQSDLPNSEGPQRLEALPEDLNPDHWSKPEIKAARQVSDRLAKEIKEKGTVAALQDLLAASRQNKDEKSASLERRVAVYAMGALDETGLLIDELAAPSAAERREAVAALRHWIGRDAKQDLALFEFLVSKKAYSEVHADILVGLLHSFGETDINRPETYSALIRYLKHDKVPIRSLAAWHLSRLVPKNQIQYDPTAERAKLEKAVQEWNKLIPEGKLPPKES